MDYAYDDALARVHGMSGRNSIKAQQAILSGLDVPAALLGLARSLKQVHSLAASLLLLTSAAGLLSCAHPTAPDLPAGAVRWLPPTRFSLWWRLTEACSDHVGDQAAVEWYIVPNATTLDVNGERLHGYWIGSSPNRIILADAHRLDGPLVRHEMLHALLQSAEHSRQSFVTDCDGVVACDGACATESGGHPSPPESAPELSPHDVGTHIDIEPKQPTVTSDGGAFVVVISISNPRSVPVWIRLTPQAPNDPFSHTFGIVTDYDDEPSRIGMAGHTWIEGSRFGLEPGAVRRYVWDLQLPVGRYGLRAYFNVDTTQRMVLSIRP